MRGGLWEYRLLRLAFSTVALRGGGRLRREPELSLKMMTPIRREMMYNGEDDDISVDC
jgi:hypothetical protein